MRFYFQLENLGESYDTILDGVTVRSCIGSAGIYARESSPTIRNVIVQNCTNSQTGNLFGTPEKTLTEIVGAGIGLLSSFSRIENCDFKYNIATGSSGGGIGINSGTLPSIVTIKNSR